MRFMTVANAPSEDSRGVEPIVQRRIQGSSRKTCRGFSSGPRRTHASSCLLWLLVATTLGAVSSELAAAPTSPDVDDRSEGR